MDASLPLFGRQAIVGMVHVGALPGTPRHADPLGVLVRRAVAELSIYEDAGLDGVIMENMHDVPYLNGGVGPEIVAAMTAIGCALRSQTRLPLGVQILAGANHEALAVAHACGADFVRVENFVFAHVSDEGLMPGAAAGPLLRYRRQIGADTVRIFADVKKKHASHALTADVGLAETARAAVFAGADGVIVTGRATGEAADPREVADVRAALRAVPGPGAPLVLVGSGVTEQNLVQTWGQADGFIVGSHFKQGGDWRGTVDPARVAAFMARVRTLRG